MGQMSFASLDFAAKKSSQEEAREAGRVPGRDGSRGAVASA